MTVSAQQANIDSASLLPGGAEVSQLIQASFDELFSSVAKTRGLSAASSAQGRVVIESRMGLRGEPLTLENTGNRMGITRERVRQIEYAHRKLIAGQRWWFNTGLPKVILDELKRRASIVVREPLQAHSDMDGFIEVLNCGFTKLDLAANKEVSIMCLAPWGASIVVESFDRAIRALWKSGFEEAVGILESCIPSATLSTEAGDSIRSRFSLWLRRAETTYLCLSRRDEICRRALFELGGTRHFSMIAQRAAEIEKAPFSPSYAHNTYAALTREGRFFIRPGGDGMFALRGHAEDTGLHLKDLMERALLQTDEWLSAEELHSRMPIGSRYQVSSIAMTAQYFPHIFKMSELFSLIQLAARKDLMMSKPVISAVEEVLRREKHCTRTELHSRIDVALPYQIDAVLSSHTRIAAIGASKHLRFVLLTEEVTKKRLTTGEFADLISAKTGLLSAPALARHIESHYGWTPGSGSIGG